jgi:hypothetical protein
MPRFSLPLYMKTIFIWTPKVVFSGMLLGNSLS